MNIQALLLILKAALPALEPTAQAAVDAQIQSVIAMIEGASGVSPDWKLVEEAALGMVQKILDAEGARLIAKVV